MIKFPKKKIPKKTNSLLNQTKQENIIKSIQLPLEDGQIQIKLNTSELQEELDFTTSNLSQMQTLQSLNQNQLPLQIQEKNTVTVESLQTDKEMTLLDRFLTCKTSTQLTLLSEILDQALTLKEKDFKQFWTNVSLEMSQKLWLPTKTDYVDSDLNCTKVSLQDLKSNSWFSIQKFLILKKTLPPTYYQSLMSFLQKLMVEENTKLLDPVEKKKRKKTAMKKRKKPTKEIIASKKYKLDITSEQYYLLKKWSGHCRKTYNSALASFNSKECSKDRLRDMFVLSTSDFYKENSYLNECPKEIREIMINRLIISIETNMNALAEGKIKHFQIQYLSKKDFSFSIPISSSCFSDEQKDGYIHLSPSKLDDKIKMKKSLISSEKFIPKNGQHSYFKLKRPKDSLEALAMNSSMIINKNKEAWFHLTYDSDKQNSKSENQGFNICSCDPGVKTFQTIYDPSGAVYKIGNKDIRRLNRLFVYMDKLQSDMTKEKNKLKKKNKYRAYHRMLDRVRNLIEELHVKTINFLVNNYNVIIIPDTNISAMVNGFNRTINSKVVRSMLTFAYYRFREKLKTKASLMNNVKVYSLTEEFTTKTCGCCGQINNVGSNDQLKCSKCKIIIDRDSNGARNIMIKFFTEFFQKILVRNNNIISNESVKTDVGATPF